MRATKPQRIEFPEDRLRRVWLRRNPEATMHPKALFIEEDALPATYESLLHIQELMAEEAEEWNEYQKKLVIYNKLQQLIRRPGQTKVDWSLLFEADAEMVLAKADIGIAQHYSRLAGELHDRFFPMIYEEFELTCELILKYSGHETLLDGDRTLQRAIMLRNPYVDPMSLMQVDLLARWRDSDYEDPKLFGALLASINGIAQGLQNTG